MPASFGPEAFSPTASATDDDLANLTGSVAGQLKRLLSTPPNTIRVITGFWVGNFTNITRVKLVRGREEVLNIARALSTAFDVEKVQHVSIGWEGTISILATTGTGPALDLYFEYMDFPKGR